MDTLIWIAIGFVFGLIPFAIVIYLLTHPYLWWPRR